MNFSSYNPAHFNFSLNACTYTNASGEVVNGFTVQLTLGSFGHPMFSARNRDRVAKFATADAARRDVQRRLPGLIEVAR